MLFACEKKHGAEGHVTGGDLKAQSECASLKLRGCVPKCVTDTI
jgi:hypothetical protein